MKPELKDKKIHQYKAALELLDNESFAILRERMGDRKGAMLKEALSANTIEDLKYSKGFLDGISYLDSLIEQWIRQGKSLGGTK